MKKTYSDKLKDPRWQRRRLEILNRDDWKCLACGNHENTLHVHHKKYTGNPWEAPDEDLETLCERCHNAEAYREDYENELIAIFREKITRAYELKVFILTLSELSPDEYTGFIMATASYVRDEKFRKFIWDFAVPRLKKINAERKTDQNESSN